MARVRGRPSLARFLALALLLVGACAKRPDTRPDARRLPLPPLEALRSDLSATFDDPSLNALWAVKVQALESGETLFERNARVLVMPASNMKIVTMAVSAVELGWDFRFKTRLETAGGIQDDTLAGDLLVVGGGDPTLSDRGGERTRVFSEWATALKARGVTRIEGRIIGDDNAYEDQSLGDGWAWDDLLYGYSTAGGALQFNEDVVRLTVEPAAVAGVPATTTLNPAGSGLEIVGQIVTGAPDVRERISLWRRPFEPRLEVSGVVPAGKAPFVRTVSIPNPTQFFVSALRDTFIRDGIAVTGEAVDIDDLDDPPGVAARDALIVHESPPLTEIGTTFMKVSQNLFGETLMSAIGLKAEPQPCATTAETSVQLSSGETLSPSDPPCRGRIIEAARKAYDARLKEWGIDPAELIVSDGSGLSRYNYVTANALVAILRQIARMPEHATLFAQTLPIMGRDGTLANRMKGTKSEGNVRAKTGTIANVRALSGYLTTTDGEAIVFSIIANNFKAPSSRVDAIAERAVERLVTFSRKQCRPF
jgi:serine-type D-Ala-D-Ala carboxypeptidase/endopeptidase (penicillin-binding protein 4)